MGLRAKPIRQRPDPVWVLSYRSAANGYRVNWHGCRRWFLRYLIGFAMTLFAAPRRSLLALLAVGLISTGCVVVSYPGTSTEFTGVLSGQQEVPPVAGNGAGTVTASLNKLTRVLSWKLNYAGLSGPVTMAHFHGPAAAGANAGVALGLPSPVTSPATGEATLTVAQVADLVAGKWYLNLHTAQHPGGEIRGQLLPR